jgi:hypothetical protein
MGSDLASIVNHANNVELHFVLTTRVYVESEPLAFLPLVPDGSRLAAQAIFLRERANRICGRSRLSWALPLFLANAFNLRRPPCNEFFDVGLSRQHEV